MDEDIRPILSDVLTQNTKPIEAFQNTVIRPILKQKSIVLEGVLKNQFVKIKFDFENENNRKIRSKIQHLFDKDHRFKQLIIGFVIGNFTMEEFEFFVQNQSEISKRIVSLVKQRLVSNYK